MSFPRWGLRLMRRHIAAVKFLETHPLPVDVAQFDHECGVGQSRIHAHSRDSFDLFTRA
jgi:hypothetical protein